MTRSAVFPCHMYLCTFSTLLLSFGVVKEGEQLGIDLVFQGRAHAVRPAGNDLELGAFHKLFTGVPARRPRTGAQAA